MAGGAPAAGDPDTLGLVRVMARLPDLDALAAAIANDFPVTGNPHLYAPDFPVATACRMVAATGIAAVTVVAIPVAIAVTDPNPHVGVVIIPVVLNDDPGDDTGQEATKGGDRLVIGMSAAETAAKNGGGDEEITEGVFHGLAFVDFVRSTKARP